MADFNANIVVTAAVDKALAAVNKIEKAINAIDTNINFSKKNSIRDRVKTEVRDAQRSFNIVAAAAKKSVEALTFFKDNWVALTALLAGTELGNAATKLLGFNNGLSQLGSAAVDAANKVAMFAAQNSLMSAGIAAGTVGLVAFAPQLTRIAGDLDAAAKRALKLGTAAGRAKNPIKELLNAYSQFTGAFDDSFFEGEIPDATKAIEAYRRALYEASETVSELGRRQDKLQATLNQFNSGSATAEKIARKLVDVNARYNAELREQADLLRRVKGLSQTTLEESKGVKSIETRKRREDFLARQSQDELQVQKALANLDQRRGTLLDQQLGIERQVTAVVRKRTEYQSKSNQTIQLRKGAQAEVQRQVAAMRALDKSQANVVFNTRLQLALAKQLVPAVTKATEEYNEQVAAQKRLNSLLEQGNRIRKQYADDRARKNKKGGPGLGENLALGIGFPLLFGGGAGSVIGSGLGSFVGSGFGGQILGGAIGQAIDQYLQSLGELGSALNPATADTQKLVEALGEANSPFNDLIQNLESSGREVTALALATQKMVDLVGQDGVNALKEFGEDSTRLGNEFAKAMTLMNSAVAQVINSVGIFKALADQLGRANLINQARNSSNPEQQERFRRFEQAGVGFGTGTDPLAKAKEREAIMQEIIEAQIQLNAEADREAQIRARLAEFDGAKVREIRASVEEKRIELEIEQLNAAANDETRIALEKKLAFQQLMTEQQALYNQFATDQITIDVLRLKLAGARLDYEIKLAEIANAAANYKPRKVGGGGGGIDKEAQVQKALAAELTKQFELETKLATIGTTKLEKINIELARLEAKRALKQAELELSTEDSRVLAAKLETLNLETAVLREQLELQRERALLEEKIADIKARQTNDKLQAQLDQELASLTLPSGNNFLDEQNALQAEQANRYANAMRDINDQLEIQRELSKSTDNAVSSAAEKRIAQLERQRGIYETMLPAIAEAEQQQLKFNQALSLVEGPVNAFVNGITSGFMAVIEGTKSVEEAFADMLKGMAQALIQQAAVMIAQYIAIGIAKAFAGMSSPTPDQQSLVTTTANSNFNALFGARAVGGPVQSNTPYVVGERGPELFVPNSGGRIVNNADSRAALDRYTPNTYSNYSSQLNITTGPVMQMDNKDYVSREDFERGLRQASDDGAKRGEALTIRRLKNSRSTRSTLGM